MEGTVPHHSSDTSQLLVRLGMGWCNAGETAGTFPATPRSQARTKLLNKLSDGKANWGQTMGEAKRTVDGIRSAADMMLTAVNKVAKTYRMEKRAVVNVLKGRKPGVTPDYAGGLASAIKEIPSAWLAHNFGLQPLLRDINDSAKALDYLLQEKTPTVMTLRAGGSDRRRAIAELSVYLGSAIPVVDCEVESSAHLSCTYDVPVSYARSLQQVGLGNPFAVAHELTPWSWAADYVSDTGDWLNSLFAREGTSFKEGSESLIMKVVNDGALIRYKAASGGRIERSTFPDAMRFSAGRFQRTVLTSTPLPWFPTFRNRLGLHQMSNLLAAMSQLGRKA